ncbi:MAG: hypothetical protein IJV85_01345 [Clostridia bacterium]|nr:hypothetical protein [Clostridia bacterium]
MDKQNTQKSYFKITFSKAIIGICLAIYVLCAAGIAASIYRMVRFGIHGFNDVLKYPFLIAVCVFCIAIVTALLIKSQYIVDEQKLTTQYGFIKSSFEIKKLTSLVYDTDSKKLSVYMGEEFFVLSLPEEQTNDFVQAIRAVKPDVEYSFTVSNKKES